MPGKTRKKRARQRRQKPTHLLAVWNVPHALVVVLCWYCSRMLPASQPLTGNGARCNARTPALDCFFRPKLDSKSANVVDEEAFHSRPCMSTLPRKGSAIRAERRQNLVATGRLGGEHFGAMKIDDRKNSCRIRGKRGAKVKGVTSVFNMAHCFDGNIDEPPLTRKTRQHPHRKYSYALRMVVAAASRSSPGEGRYRKGADSTSKGYLAFSNTKNRKKASVGCVVAVLDDPVPYRTQHQAETSIRSTSVLEAKARQDKTRGTTWGQSVSPRHGRRSTLRASGDGCGARVGHVTEYGRFGYVRTVVVGWLVSVSYAGSLMAGISMGARQD
ncbi:hypothetical protein IWX50DRAFT_619424 [Phyllosticta citricarpa]|uniref:Uncharacterized protein n=1 Tax=Phyllosticta citricarpa TaxID=55181 RepID=A0ABR1MG62_9PEZI